MSKYGMSGFERMMREAERPGSGGLGPRKEIAKPKSSEAGFSEAASYADVLTEIDRAMNKFPTWPTDPLHALAVMNEEVGELTKEIVQLIYEPHKSSPEAVREEAIQMAAMALRFLSSLDKYEYQPGAQHEQHRGCAACDRGDYQLGHAVWCPHNDRSEEPSDG